MPRIFISYSRKDIDAANHIAHELKQRGADVFVDYQRLKAGENFPERLATEIEQSDAVVFLLSQHSAVSDWVRDEIQYARHCRKKIIPVGLDVTNIPRAFFFLMAVERVDFTRWQTDRQVEAAIAKLAAALELPVELTPPPNIVESSPVGAVREPPLQTPSPPINTPPIALPDLSAVLPPPFDWCPIPAGKVTLKEGGYVPEGGQMFDVPAFVIARYPVTNAQFRRFVDAGGYRQQKWWTLEGWQVREREKWSLPRFSNDNKWNGDDYPAVGVSWYEAMAFCNWLRVELNLTPYPPLHRNGEGGGPGWGVSLPTEQQWQRAAQGDDGREYPWGHEADAGRCNVLESRIEQTTAVTRYPSGASPYGVMDMAGNVWEWCLTDYDSGLMDANKSAAHLVLRGGSWNDSVHLTRCASRYGDGPNDGYFDLGFRVLVGVPSL